MDSILMATDEQFDILRNQKKHPQNVFDWPLSLLGLYRMFQYLNF